MIKTVTMELDDKKCKNVYRYKESEDDAKAPAINYLYIKKYIFEGKPANMITVTISDERM